MRIALTGPITRPITAMSKGGVEKWMYTFAQECEKRNHRVDLYALKGSITSKLINLIEVFPQSPQDLYQDKNYFTDDIQTFTRNKTELFSALYTNILLQLKNKEQEYDVLIDSTFNHVFTLNTKFLTLPTIVVSHVPINYKLEFLVKQFGIGKNNTYVFLNHNEEKKASFIGVNQKQVIPNGIDVSKFVFNPIGGEKMTWVSRVDHLSANKGLEQAMIAANTLQIPLQSWGFVEIGSVSYYENIIKKLISSYVSFTRNNLTDQMDYNETLGKAKVFLFPLQWEEPFGLVQAEAMACGTPIIAFAKGSVPEVIRDGETGYIVNYSNKDIRGDWIIKKTGMEGLFEAIKKLYALPVNEYKQMRLNCRKHVESAFSIQKMVDRYLNLAQKLKFES